MYNFCWLQSKITLFPSSPSTRSKHSDEKLHGLLEKQSYGYERDLRMKRHLLRTQKVVEATTDIDEFHSAWP